MGKYSEIAHNIGILRSATFIKRIWLTIYCTLQCSCNSQMNCPKDSFSPNHFTQGASMTKHRLFLIESHADIEALASTLQIILLAHQARSVSCEIQVEENLEFSKRKVVVGTTVRKTDKPFRKTS